MWRIVSSILSLVAASVVMTQTIEVSPSTTQLQQVSLQGIINNDSDDTLAFMPDGNTVFFDRSAGPHKTIFVSHLLSGRWSSPEIASFSGSWFDQDPVVAPDGSYLLFNSDRPTPASASPLTQTYFSKVAAPGSNIWRVDRFGEGWGKPRWIGPDINNDVFVDFASIARDNTLYFMRWDAPNRIMQLWRARYTSGQYGAPERVALGDPSVSIHDPAISPDQSFIIFDYGKVAGGLGRLCISFFQDGRWSAPLDFGDSVNQDLPWGSHLAPDGHTVYVTGRSGIWRLDIRPWLNRRAPASASGPTQGMVEEPSAQQPPARRVPVRLRGIADRLSGQSRVLDGCPRWFPATAAAQIPMVQTTMLNLCAGRRLPMRSASLSRLRAGGRAGLTPLPSSRLAPAAQISACKTPSSG